MHAGATIGFVGVGAVATTLGLFCMLVWKCTPTLTAWLMFIGGACFAVASWKPLKIATKWVLSGSNTVGSWLGVGSVVALILALVLTIHAVRTFHPKKGPKAKKSAAWAAFFAPSVIVALGGVVAVATKTGDLFHQIGDGLSALLGGQ